MSNSERDTTAQIPAPSSASTADAWAALKQFTQARLALGRAGHSLPTRALLEFQLDHARAADAVHRPLEVEQLSDELISSGAAGPDQPIDVSSLAADRFTYLQRPDLGRRLSEAAWQQLRDSVHNDDAIDLVIVIADGLSPIAVQHHAAPFIVALRSHLEKEVAGYRVAPLIIATQARVALGDDIGESLNARMVLVLIGERPGLTSPDSMGAYLTWAPRRGVLDAQRNCISNIRAAGLGYDEASAKAWYLLREAARLQQSGVALKDREDHDVANTDSGAIGVSRFRLTQGDA